MSSQIIIEKKRPKAIGPWFESRTPKEQSDFFRRAARAQWGPKKIPPKKAERWAMDLANRSGTIRPLSATNIS